MSLSSFLKHSPALSSFCVEVMVPISYIHQKCGALASVERPRIIGGDFPRDHVVEAKYMLPDLASLTHMLRT